MTQRVQFNGATLTRPGAYTKIDVSQFQNIQLTGVGIVGLIGEADDGKPREVQVFSSPGAVKAFYRSGDLVEAAALVADPSNDTLIPSGAQSIVCYKINNSAPGTRTHASTFVYTTKRYGVAANSVTIGVAAGTGSSRIVTVTDFDDYGSAITEVSPELGAAGKFSIQYTGAATACTMTITATTMTLTTASASIPADDLTITFADWNNLQEIINYINAHPSYTCTTLITNSVTFDPTYLDAVASVSVISATVVYARNYDIWDWVNTNSQIVTAAITKGQTSPVAVLAAGAFSGGTRGTSSNSDWTTALQTLRSVRINQLVLLASQDATTVQGTFTIDSLVAAIVAHCKYVSSTPGRNECQGWMGVNKSLTAWITLANLHNSEHLCLLAQKPQRARTFDGRVVFFPEWAYACIAAGMRAGAPLGEPLTRKYVNVVGQSQDTSWDPLNDDNVSLALLNGLWVVTFVRGKGFRFEKGITTYTRSNNNALQEETILQTIKALSFDIRTALEETYVGRPGFIDFINTVPTVITTVCSGYRDRKAITDTSENGAVKKAWRDIAFRLREDVLETSVTVTPTPGINFVLHNTTFLPARVS